MSTIVTCVNDKGHNNHQFPILVWGSLLDFVLPYLVYETASDGLPSI